MDLFNPSHIVVNIWDNALFFQRDTGMLGEVSNYDVNQEGWLPCEALLSAFERIARRQ